MCQWWRTCDCHYWCVLVPAEELFQFKSNSSVYSLNSVIHWWWFDCIWETHPTDKRRNGSLPHLSCTRLIRQNRSPPGAEFHPAESKAESKARTNPQIKIPAPAPVFNCFLHWQIVHPHQVSLSSSAVSKMLLSSKFPTLRLGRAAHSHRK